MQILWLSLQTSIVSFRGSVSLGCNSKPLLLCFHVSIDAVQIWKAKRGARVLFHNLKDQMTLRSRGPPPLYYESLYGI